MSQPIYCAGFQGGPDSRASAQDAHRFVADHRADQGQQREGLLLNVPKRHLDTPAKRATAITAVLAVLLGFGATAFSVAPLTVTDSAPVTVRILTEALATPEDLDDQVETLADQPVILHRSHHTQLGDTMDTLLKRLGVDDPQAALFLRQNTITRKILSAPAGKLVSVTTSGGGVSGASLSDMVVLGPPSQAERQNSHASQIHITRQGKTFKAEESLQALQTQTHVSSVQVDSNLFAAADQAQLPESIARQVSDVFANDMDFRHGLRPGDHFTVIYETLSLDAEPIPWVEEPHHLIAAQFVNQGRSFDAFWFAQAGRGHYFDAQGLSKEHQFLADPLPMSRITSGFAGRMHPIHHHWHNHLGIDYAAPKGTPVRAVGAGQVVFAGWQKGYGNVVRLRHSDAQETVYAHLSRSNVKLGQNVVRGQSMGAVGSTGWATGPHLHFEFKIDGRQVDPVNVARETPPLTTLASNTRKAFQSAAKMALAQLAATQTAESPKVAMARME
ncbi:metalloendopeptidase-like membrane protein [Leptothrix ochracea L12]|uniref:Metalloendopeptidase-like membrane protein n=1 Tax=Leptothrix ochracea L12 TaxID=735332 RepID=I4Z536_9BURK|nr:M23 family metallopeptidase [Leptothrix ochracea]EIM31328.1 metalloendopeptidase-like membrane protein [Leptothrix ochracea L12]